MKTCKTCKQTKELSQFHKNRLQSDGHMIHCAECSNKKKREQVAVADTKRCTKCRKYKLLTEYCVKSGDKTGYNSQCKQCASIYQKARGIAKAKPKRPHREGQKACAGCGEMKDYSRYPRSRSSKDGYVHKCKACYTTTKKKASMEINYAAFYYPVALD